MGLRCEEPGKMSSRETGRRTRVGSIRVAAHNTRLCATNPRTTFPTPHVKQIRAPPASYARLAHVEVVLVQRKRVADEVNRHRVKTKRGEQLLAGGGGRGGQREEQVQQTAPPAAAQPQPGTGWRSAAQRSVPAW